MGTDQREKKEIASVFAFRIYPCHPCNPWLRSFCLCQAGCDGRRRWSTFAYRRVLTTDFTDGHGSEGEERDCFCLCISHLSVSSVQSVVKKFLPLPGRM